MKQTGVLGFASKEEDVDVFKTFSKISAVFEDLERTNRNANRKGIECGEKLAELITKISALETEVEDKFKLWKAAQEKYFFASPTLQLVEKLYEATLKAMKDLKEGYVSDIRNAVDAYKNYFEESEESYQQLALEVNRIIADGELNRRFVKLKKGVEAFADKKPSSLGTSVTIDE